MRIHSQTPAPITIPTAQTRPAEESHREPSDSFGPRVLGALAGGIVGALAGRSGAAGVSAVAGFGAAAVTGSYAVPYLKKAVDDGINSDPINNVALVCSTTFAGGVLLASSAAAAAALAYPLALAIPAAAPILGAIAGAASGAALGIWN